MATTRYTYTDSNRVIRAVAANMDMLSPTQAVLLRLLGFGNDNLRMINPTSWSQDKIEWLTDTEHPRSILVNEALDNSETDVTLDTGQGAYVKDYSIIKIGDEVMLVTAHASADVLTVTRGWGGSTAAAHDDDSTIYLLGPAALEGGAFESNYSTTSSVVYNYNQIFRYKLSASRSAMKAPQYGDTQDPLAREMMKLWDDGGTAGQAAKDLMMTFYHGRRNASARSSTVPGTMGGFEQFVTTNAVSGASQQIDKPKIHSMLRSIVDAGGEATHIVGSTYMIEKVAALYEDERRTTRDELLGGSEIQQIISPAHPMPIKLVADYLCPTDRLYFINTSYCGWVPFDEFMYKELPTSNDGVDWGFVGEYTFVARNENKMGYLYGLATA